MSTKAYDRTYPLSPHGAYFRDYAACSGVDTPSSLRAQGILQDNFYTAEYESVWNGPISYKFRNIEGYPVTNTHMIGLGAFVRPGVVELMSNYKSYANLLEKYRQSEFNLAVTAGEARESWHMIADRMIGFATAMRHVRKGNLRDALRALGSSKRPSRRSQRKLDSGDVSGSFLELHYGWVPLLQDIFAAAELVEKPYVHNPSIRTSDRVEGAPVRYVTSTFEGTGWAWQQLNQRRVYHLTRLSTKEVSWAFRLGLTNPAAIAWELIPFSFLFDWFLPISDIIAAHEALKVIPVGRHVRTDVLKSFCGMTVPENAFIPGYHATTRSVTSGLYWRRRTDMSRIITSELPPEVYTGNGPRQSLISFDASLRRVSAASALLHQAFRRM